MGSGIRQQIEIRPFANGWGVRYQNVEQGPYLSCELALAVAAIHARRASAAGVRMRIIVQGRDGAVQAEWPLLAETARPVSATADED